jgi:sulfite exporter TauE/SafE
MCGGFPLHLARTSQRAPVWVRQLLYVAGKTFTYAFLGALFGAVGSHLGQQGWLPHSQKYVAIVAGVVIMLFGLGMVGVRLPSLAHRFNAPEGGFVPAVYSHFFAHPGGWSSFLLGVATGFLPCPITLGILFLAGASQSVLQGMITMAGLGVGTAPGLVAVGLCGHLVDAKWRRIGLRPAGVIVIALGLLTVLRTQDFMHKHCHSPAAGAGPTCPHHATPRAEAETSALQKR